MSFYQSSEYSHYPQEALDLLAELDKVSTDFQSVSTKTGPKPVLEPVSEPDVSLDLPLLDYEVLESEPTQSGSYITDQALTLFVQHDFMATSSVCPQTCLVPDKLCQQCFKRVYLPP